MVKLKYQPGFRELEYDLVDGRKVTIQNLPSIRRKDWIAPLGPFFVEAFKLADNDAQFQQSFAQIQNCVNILPARRPGITCGEKEMCGLGVYMVLPFFKHSCRPNVCRIGNGLKVQIRAIDYIDTDKQEILTKVLNDEVQYVDLRQK